MTEVSAGTLTDFLLERIAEDEKRNTKHRLPDDFKCPVNPADDITKIGVPVGGHRGDWAATLYPCGHNVTPDQYDAAAVAVPRSARVLAECEAKRRIVAEVSSWRHDVSEDCWYTCPAATDDVDGGECCDDTRRGGSCDCGRDHRVAMVLGALTSVYADHPDYRPEWRP